MADKEGTSDKTNSNEQSSQISEQERDLAQLALTEFNKMNFAACLHHLSKLESARPNDVKVIHNRVVAEFYKSELKKTDVFRKSLNQVCQQAHVNVEDCDALEDVEHCVLFYNQSVVLYHLQQHQSALKLMNKVFSFIEPMEEGLAHRVCLLLIELHLSTQQPDQALSLIAYIENQFVSTENATKMIGDKDLKTLEKEHQEKAPVTLDAATDAFRLKLLQYKTRCYLSTCAIKACKRELKSIVTANNAVTSNLAPVFLKGNLEYIRGNYNKSIKVLSSIPLTNSVNIFKESGESPSLLFYNNMGCLHHYMAKPNLSAFYLQKALQENEAAMKAYPKPDQGEPLSGRPLYCVGSNKSPILMYNLGVALLHGGKPTQAFDCLIEAVQVYHTNPRLWLRLAECCIMAHKESNAGDFDFKARRNDLVQGVIGSGVHRKIILNPNIWKDSKYSCEPRCESYAIPVVSLEFSSLCLRNALLLLPSTGGEGGPPVPAPPSPPVDPRQVPVLRACVLAASAYVALCLGDPVICLEHSKALLAQPNLSGAHKLLARLYAGEAYVLLDKIPAAIELLNPEQMAELVDPRVRPLRPWFPATTATGRAVLQYNLAVALALRGELDKAGDMLKQVWKSKGPNCDVPIHVIALALYIELLLGHTDIARNIIKQNCPQLQR
ncbi:CCR4-NOT transcription complex subunit 10 [Macrosteles quadrilineatus]|uniref:CCR4-NOT transcription complex subunit 10 n=1 Tax=Macrosteles quadrilineatus TaxID=74068 RepID=UPI0023E30E59|nr:CCR4-NOT transcription complex subunit 10 [Macrosteles quadrilineatus]